MKKVKLILIISTFIPTIMWAKGGDHNKKPTAQLNLAAGCAPASDLIFLEFNNVRTRVEAGGLWWQDRANGVADYEVPRGSNSFALFAGGLWLAGQDINGQLKAAVSLFGTGVDFYTGPLDTVGTAEIDPATCEEFDRFFEISRAEVAQFFAFTNAVANGTASEDFPGYQIPNSILDWPGNGDVSRGQANRIAPFVDVDGDGFYDPERSGDYPFYDLEGNIDCRANRENRSISTQRPLFGDQTFYWIFNDKGNLHTESNAPSIGMEVHGQAFAFATNDEINDMTFYNFELINRSTFTLTETYFASYVDPDLGNSTDDYVGCDVVRGLGYCFNGDDLDEDFRGQTGYGANPAAIGIDFFEGPFQDADGINNLVGIRPGEALNGLGYFDPTAQNPDLVPDNERFGMRRFVYYINGTGDNGDPTLAIHYYNYMRGIWRNGQLARHGGDGLRSTGVENIPTAFMFPGDTDPLHWGTTNEEGFTTIPQNTNWTEDNPGGGAEANAPGDRRFLQSAGPFTLEPGNVNDITVGVVFAQAASGGRLASVESLFSADDRAQSLFDNCFQVLTGPDAPDVEVQELDRSLIFYLSNPVTSNNYKEGYVERDTEIITPDSLLAMEPPIIFDDSFRFQGYQIYQLAGPGISVNDLGDPSRARLAFQSDIRDEVEDLINFEFDESLNANVPSLQVSASNEGIRRSFEITEDLFATGDNRLINFRTYYFIAIAYAFNEFKPYAQDVPPNPANPLAPAFDGQTTPYISSRRSGTGAAVQAFSAIPHTTAIQDGGTIATASFGDQLEITRLQGKGNGGNALSISDESIDELFREAVWERSSETVGRIGYTAGAGPFNITVIDPLNVVEGTYFLQILDETDEVTPNSTWKIWRQGGGPADTVFSDRVISVENEQLLLDPNWGLSISLLNGGVPGTGTVNPAPNNGFISASITYDDPNRAWLSGISDTDQEAPTNWILSGTNNQGPLVFQDGGNRVQMTDPVRDTTFLAFSPFDPNEDYESILSGTFAPYNLVRGENSSTDDLTGGLIVNAPGNSQFDIDRSPLDRLNSIQLVITNDRSRWSRCPVVETADQGIVDANGNLTERNRVKNRLSVDKDGNPVDTTGLGGMSNEEVEAAVRARENTEDEENAAFVSAFGMGWFPGYVFNKETGERLNIVFGEDSRFSFNNGNDMIWNPTETIVQGVDLQFINNVWGGKHYIYIMRRALPEDEVLDEGLGIAPNARMPVYDNGETARRVLSSNNEGTRQNGWANCIWVGVPTLIPGEEVLATDVRIDINVSQPFGVQDSDLDEFLDNDGKPVYEFNTNGRGARRQSRETLSNEIENIGVVPNPYHAISEFEETQLDNVVKFTNLPENCTIRIYNPNGTLIRTYNKSSPLTFLDWDLNNQAGVPISSGVYIIHVEVPGVGEKILKWFGVVRPVDLNNF